MSGFEMIVPLISVVGFFSIPIIAIVMYWWCEIRKVHCDAAIKREMVARGYSANEIVYVLTNGKCKPANDPSLDLVPAKPVKVPVFN